MAKTVRGEQWIITITLSEGGACVWSVSVMEVGQADSEGVMGGNIISVGEEGEYGEAKWQ